MSMSATTEDV